MCDICKQEYGSLASHKGGTATCAKKAICSVCGQEYGSLASHQFNAEMYSCEICGISALYRFDGPVLTDIGSATVTVSKNSYDYYNSSLKPYYSKIIAFCSTETRSYTFAASCSGDSYGRLHDVNMTSLKYDDDGNGHSDFKITYTCTAGEIYYLAAGMYNSSSSGTVTVTIS